jgi:putative ABC transport system substrate-binding protein
LGTGLVQSLAHPGGNVTVISQNSPDTNGKRLELLRQIVPSTIRIGVLYSTWNQAEVVALPSLVDAARVLGVEIVPAPVSSPNARDLSSLDQAVNVAIANNAQAFYVSPPAAGVYGYSHIATRLKDLELASVAGDTQFAEVGGLMTYGADVAAIYRRAGYFVDRILKGISPADLPFEFPTVFDIAINQSTAAAIGVTIPPEVALQVTEWVP